MQHIVITGATGLIGNSLLKLLSPFYRITALSRNAVRYANSPNIIFHSWDGKETFTEILENAYAVINLAGENIGGKRWTPRQKQLIIDSRVNAANAVKNSILQCKSKPEVWIQASATGYYGKNKGATFDEYSPEGEHSFLAGVCAAWEKPTNETDIPGLRKIIIRTGVVFSPQSELWKKLIKPFRFRIAVVPGSGRQYLPWIHIDDEISAIKFLLENKECSGIFNLAAPVPATMSAIVKEIKIYKKPLLTLNIPKILVGTVFGKEMTEEIILTDQRVVPSRLLEYGFHFKYGYTGLAIPELLKK